MEVFLKKKLNPFAKSDLGILEYQLCKTFHKLPHEIGRARNINPDSIRFLEIAMMEEWKEIKKEREKARRKSRRPHRR